MRERIKKVMSELWGLSIQEIPDNAAANELQPWDSIAHLQLLLALELEFDIQFATEDMGKMLTLKDLENHVAALAVTA